MSTQSSTLQLNITAKDDASKKLQDISSASTKLKGAFLAVGAAAGAAFAVAKIVSFGKESFKAFNAAEASSARVGATLATMGEKGLKAKDAIEKMSQAVTKLGFDDEDAAESIAKLFQRTGDLTQAQNLNAIAMDLARAKNIDLATASTLVGQVLSGNGRVLKQYGIDIDESATPLDALGVLHGKVAGQAAAFSTTTQGKIEELKVSYENLQETAGATLSSIAKPFLDLANSTLLFISNGDAMKKKLTEILEYIDQKTGLITIIKDAWSALSFVFTEQLLPALIELWESLQPLKPFLEALAVVFGGLLLVAIVTVVNVIAGLAVAVTTLLTWFAKLSTYIVNNLTKDFEKLQKYIEPVAKLIERVVNGIQKISSGAIDKVKNLFNSDGGSSKSKVNDAIISPNGRVITTNPNDYLIATQNPSKLGGGGASYVVNINGGTYLSEEVAGKIGDMIIKKFQRTVRI